MEFLNRGTHLSIEIQLIYLGQSGEYPVQPLPRQVCHDEIRPILKISDMKDLRRWSGQFPIDVIENCGLQTYLL